MIAFRNFGYSGASDTSAREREREMGGGLEELSEEEKRALRGSKFAPLPSVSAPSRSQPRLAHPGGPLKTNKAAALAKFLERKLQEPNGLASVNPDLLELAVKNAKETVTSGGTSTSGKTIRHVSSFGDPEDSSSEKEKVENSKLKKKSKEKKTKKEEEEEKKKKKKKKKKSKTQKVASNENAKLKRPNKKVKL